MLALDVPELCHAFAMVFMMEDFNNCREILAPVRECLKSRMMAPKITQIESICMAYKTGSSSAELFGLRRDKARPNPFTRIIVDSSCHIGNPHHAKRA